MEKLDLEKEIPSIKILKNAVELRAEDWRSRAVIKYSKKEWERMNPIDPKLNDYLMLGLLKYLDEKQDEKVIN